MLVSNLLAKLTDTTIGYIKVIEIDSDMVGSEKSLIGFTGEQLADFMGKNCKAYYTMGEYLYIVM